MENAALSMALCRTFSMGPSAGVPGCPEVAEEQFAA